MSSVLRLKLQIKNVKYLKFTEISKSYKCSTKYQELNKLVVQKKTELNSEPKGKQGNFPPIKRAVDITHTDSIGHGRHQRRRLKENLT